MLVTSNFLFTLPFVPAALSLRSLHASSTTRLSALEMKYSNPRALDLDINTFSSKSSSVQLTTGIYRFTKDPSSTKSSPRNDPTNDLTVDLFSMVHIADKSYYEAIRDISANYDVVLYELITDRRNCELKDGYDYKRQLKTEIFTPEAERLSKEYSLETQAGLYNTMAPNWYIADLDAQTVASLESSRRAETIGRFRLSQIAGRGATQRFLKKFFLSDAFFLTALRLLSWLAPCPELSCLVIDWSRMTPKAGGLPAVLVPIIENVLAGRLVEAKKLAFAQQLLSGIPDAGAWGGEAMSDITVRVTARNAECCRVLTGFIEEFDKGSSSSTDGSITGSYPVLSNNDKGEERSLKVAILYGAYHINDLSKKIKGLGLVQVPYKPLEGSRSLTTTSSDTATPPPPSSPAAISTVTTTSIATISPPALPRHIYESLTAAKLPAWIMNQQQQQQQWSATQPESTVAATAGVTASTSTSSSSSSGGSTPSSKDSMAAAKVVVGSDMVVIPPTAYAGAPLTGISATTTTTTAATSIAYGSLSSTATTTAVALDDNKSSTDGQSSSDTMMNMAASAIIANNNKSSSPVKLIASIVAAASAYLLFGALDWWVLFDFLAELAEKVLLLDRGSVLSAADAVSNDSGNIAMTLLNSLNNFDSSAPSATAVNSVAGSVSRSVPVVPPVPLDVPFATSFTVLYVLLYVQRHTLLLRSVSSFGIQWDRGLYDDAVPQENDDDDDS